MKSARYNDRKCHACDRMGRPWAELSWPSKDSLWSLLLAIDRHDIGTYWTLRRSKCSGCASVARVIRQVGLLRYLYNVGVLDKVSDVAENWILSLAVKDRNRISGKIDVDVGKSLLVFLSSLGIEKGLDGGEYLNPGWLNYVGELNGKGRFLDEY